MSLLTIIIALSLAQPDGSPPCFGVTPDKLAAGPTYRLNGQTITPAAAYEALEKGLDDDGRKLRVTIIGPPVLRQKARDDLESHPAFAELQSGLAIRDFAPDHWAMRAGFVTTGQPTIYCQAPDGKVLHRQDNFAGGADALVGALRRAKESYDPRRDPDLRSPFAKFTRYGSFAAATGLGAIIFYLIRRFTHVQS